MIRREIYAIFCFFTEGGGEKLNGVRFDLNNVIFTNECSCSISDVDVVSNAGACFENTATEDKVVCREAKCWDNLQCSPQRGL